MYTVYQVIVIEHACVVHVCEVYNVYYRRCFLLCADDLCALLGDGLLRRCDEGGGGARFFVREVSSSSLYLSLSAVRTRTW